MNSTAGYHTISDPFFSSPIPGSHPGGEEGRNAKGKIEMKKLFLDWVFIGGERRGKSSGIIFRIPFLSSSDPLYSQPPPPALLLFHQWHSCNKISFFSLLSVFSIFLLFPFCTPQPASLYVCM